MSKIDEMPLALTLELNVTELDKSKDIDSTPLSSPSANHFCIIEDKLNKPDVFVDAGKAVEQKLLLSPSATSLNGIEETCPCALDEDTLLFSSPATPTRTTSKHVIGTNLEKSDGIQRAEETLVGTIGSPDAPSSSPILLLTRGKSTSVANQGAENIAGKHALSSPLSTPARGKRTRFIGYQTPSDISDIEPVTTSEFERIFPPDHPANLIIREMEARKAAEAKIFINAKSKGVLCSPHMPGHFSGSSAPGDDGSVWSMEYKESSDTEERVQNSEDGGLGMQYDIGQFLFQKGHIIEAANLPFMDNQGLPLITYSNMKNGQSFTSFVKKDLYTATRYTTYHHYDPETLLWKDTDSYISHLQEHLSKDSIGWYPILHRHGRHQEFTNHPLTSEENSIEIRTVTNREWDRLALRYGDFNDLQNEQRMLIDRAFYMLRRYQLAVASRNLADAMSINNLIGQLRDALDELSLDEYAIRELFYSASPAQFLLATDAI